MANGHDVEGPIGKWTNRPRNKIAKNVPEIADDQIDSGDIGLDVVTLQNTHASVKVQTASGEPMYAVLC